MPAGRPSEYTEELAAKICDRIAEGESLVAICSDPAMPSRATIYNWFQKHEGFVDNYARAKEEHADAIFDEILLIADTASPEEVQQARLRIDARKWMAGKLRPKVYGEKQEVKHTGGVQIQVVDNFADDTE